MDDPHNQKSNYHGISVTTFVFGNPKWRLNSLMYGTKNMGYGDESAYGRYKP